MELRQRIGSATCLFLVTTLLLFGSAGNAQVHRSASGTGDALILPYWTTSNGNDSLLSIRNDSERAVALKLLWLDEEGGLVYSFNLYLNGRSMWTGATVESVRLGENTSPNPSVNHLYQSNACLLPLDLNVNPEDEVDFFEIGAPRGSLEIIEMASVDPASALAPEGRWIDCPNLAARFETGAWSSDLAVDLRPPAGRMSATIQLINVAVGGMNTIEATALAGFSDSVQHTAPLDYTPDLSHASDTGADAGGVRSLVCAHGDCRVDEWSLPIKAVAAALTASALVTDYSVNPGLAAQFEWFLHRPLYRYQASIPELQIDSAPLISFFTREGEQYVVCPPEDSCIVFPLPDQPVPGTSEFDFELEPSLHVIALSHAFEPLVNISPLLGHPIEQLVRVPRFSSSNPEALNEGILRLRFDQQETSLTAPAGHRYLGEPVIAFGIQQFSNGTLVDAAGGSVLANYRGTETPRYHRTIVEPD